ncbi:fungal specific transcription factor domain-containing protein [Seiridium cupressi]
MDLATTRGTTGAGCHLRGLNSHVAGDDPTKALVASVIPMEKNTAWIRQLPTAMQSQEVRMPIQAMKQPQRSNTRARIPLSCDPCRTRKLKCNREKPCQNCAARNEHENCMFHGPKNGPSPQAQGSTNGNAMRQRIDRLEEMVKKLVTERGKMYSSSSDAVYTPESSEPETGPAASAAAPETHEVGVGKTVMDGIHSVYLGGNDWDVINEIKRTCSQDQDEDEVGFSFNPASSHTVDGASLLFSQAKPIERIEILSTLPHKPEVDRLISQFFNHETFPITVPPILHAPTFMNEYDEHWRDPSRTSFMWLGLLFSILGITMLAYHQYGEPTESEGMAESLFQLYRIRTAQCLLSGDIAKCLPYTVETLRFNATAELNRKDDNRRGLWMMTGVVVRAAINMGYHREPSLSSGISVIQAEYRRRIWLSVTSMDDMASLLGGFPRMMSAVYSDTKEPHNLLDSELSQHTTSLPPSRPLTEETPMTYLIIKTRMFRVLGRVPDFHSAPSLGSYDTVLDIDQALHEIYQNFLLK